MRKGGEKEVRAQKSRHSELRRRAFLQPLGGTSLSQRKRGDLLEQADGHQDVH